MTPYTIKYYMAIILKDVNAKPSNIIPIFSDFRNLKLKDL